jgi:biotin carboxyl carrier protein
VKPGTAVKENDQVLTLEAMKMNTVIYAPAAGTVTSFCVAPGDTVAENQPLAYLG